jgi:16S rRNA (guanine527-N7)-methyltransferase
MNSNDDSKIITLWCEERNFEIDQQRIQKFTEYLAMIREASKKMNLVSKNDLNQLAQRHLIDSLHALTAYDIPQGAKTADMGSGAGFPGIPIAIARPNLSVDLIESRRLKSLFLAKVIENLKLPNAKAIHSRWEDISNKYDIIFARAVYNETDLRSLAIPHLNSGGVLVYFEKYLSIKIIKASE